jgi:hypothetical protein
VQNRLHAVVFCDALLLAFVRAAAAACRIDDDTMAALLNSSPALRALEIAGMLCSLRFAFAKVGVCACAVVVNVYLFHSKSDPHSSC